MDLENARQVAVDAAEAAGALLGKATREPIAVTPKGTAGDVVTELDYAAERVILGRLGRAFPDHRIISEEAGDAGAGSSRWTWLVDPLDGTNNVAIGLPVYAVGLALCEDGIPVVAVAHNPVTGETHSALRDGGLHGVVATRRRLGDDLILVWTQGHPVSRRDPRARALQTALDAEARRILRLWAPLLGWMMLAAGRVDGVVGYRAEMLEMPVGLLMARESGNVVVDLRGEPFDERFDVGERSFVACRPERLDRLLSLVAAAG